MSVKGNVCVSSVVSQRLHKDVSQDNIVGGVEHTMNNGVVRDPVPLVATIWGKTHFTLTRR